jgi:hypothetical protein
MSVQNFNRARYNTLRRDAQPLRLSSSQTETPEEKKAHDLRGLRLALRDLEPLRFLPEISARIETLKAEIAVIETELASVAA